MITAKKIDIPEWIVGWGTGNYFRDIVAKEEYDQISFLVDGDPAKWGSSIAGIPVCSPEALREMDPAKTLVVVFSTFFDEIEPRIVSLGHENCCPGKQWVALQLQVNEAALLEAGSEAELARLYWRRAGLCRRAGVHWQALDALQRAVTADGRNPQWHWELGQAYRYMQRFADAAASCYQAIQLASDPPATWYYQAGLMFEAAGKPEKASHEYNQAIAVHPSTAAKDVGVAYFHHVAGEYSKEIDELAKRPDLHTNPFLAFRLGKAYERNFLWEQAATAYRSALSLDPGRKYWWYRLGSVCERCEDWDAAVDAYETALQVPGVRLPFLRYRLGYSLYQQAEYERACDVFIAYGSATEDDVIGYDPPHAGLRVQCDGIDHSCTAWYNQGIALSVQENWCAAVDALREAVCRDARQAPSGFFSLGKALYMIREYRAACRAFLQMEPLRRVSLIPSRRMPDAARLYLENRETLPVQEQVVLYDFSDQKLSGALETLCGSFPGGAEDKPWHHVWVVKDLQQIPDDIKKRNDMVFVEKGTPLYGKYLATTKFLISDAGLPAYFSRRSSQRYLCVWSEKLQQKVCRTMRAGDAFAHKYIVRNMLHVTHFQCPCQAQGMGLLQSLRIKNTFAGVFLVGDIAQARARFFFGVDAECPSCHDTGKQSVLLGCLPFTPNGITTALLNLLKLLPRDSYHTTLLLDPNAVSGDDGCMQKYSTVPSDVEIVCRAGKMNVSEDARWVIQRMREHLTLDSDALWQTYAKAYERECERLLGGAQFDALVDFWGYSPVLTSLFAFAPRRYQYRSVYMHNTMDREQKIKFPKLKTSFELYRYFDRVIAVSQAGQARQIDKIGGVYDVPVEKFAFCRYAIDPGHVRQRASEAIQDRVFKDRPDGHIHFLVVGRLSPEKGYEKLLQAFASVHHRFPQTHLWSLGDGPLRADVQKWISELGLQDAAHMLGVVDNPFPYMKAADCLVLSSDHEGQPLTLLEAMTLGTPIIATKIDGVKELLREHNYGNLVENNIDGLADGMMSFVENRMTVPIFDAHAYQQKSLEAFMLYAIGGGPDAMVSAFP